MEIKEFCKKINAVPMSVIEDIKAELKERLWEDDFERVLEIIDKHIERNERMKIVIDIPENIYNLIARGEESRDFVYKSDLMRAILEGTPLPKGHGRLIDADAFERRCMFDSDIEDMQDVIYALRDYKSIIEADRNEVGK